MTKVLTVLAAIFMVALMLSPVPLGLVLLICGAIIPQQHWPYRVRLITRFAKYKSCKLIRKVI